MVLCMNDMNTYMYYIAYRRSSTTIQINLNRSRPSKVIIIYSSMLLFIIVRLMVIMMKTFFFS